MTDVNVNEFNRNLIGEFRANDGKVTGEVAWTRSNKHTGIRRLPVQLTPKERAND